MTFIPPVRTTLASLDDIEANEGKVPVEMGGTDSGTAEDARAVLGLRVGIDVPTLSHTHDDRYYTQSQVDAIMSGVIVGDHDHDDRYYTEAEIDAMLGGFVVGDHNHEIGDVIGLADALAGKAPTVHTHLISSVTGLDDALATKATLAHSHAMSDVTGLSLALAGKADASHVHDDRYYTEAEVTGLLDGKAPSAHTHDDRYYTESEADSLLSGKSDVGHGHESGDISDFEAAVSALVGDGGGGGGLVSSFGPTQIVIDEVDSGYTESAGWSSTAGGYAGSSHYVAGGDGSVYAEWVFNDVANGNVPVYATWSAHTNRASNATYKVYDDAALVGSLSVNQKFLPSGPVVNGSPFLHIGNFDITSGILRVRLDNNADAYVIADAIMIMKPDDTAGTVGANAVPGNIIYWNVDGELSQDDTLAFDEFSKTAILANLLVTGSFDGPPAPELFLRDGNIYLGDGTTSYNGMWFDQPGAKNITNATILSVPGQRKGLNAPLSEYVNISIGNTSIAVFKNEGVGLHTDNPAGSLHVVVSFYATSGLVVQAHAANTGNFPLLEIRNSSGTPLMGFYLSGVMSLHIAITDANAPINSLFRGSDHSGSLCWKNAAGTVTVIAP